MINIFLLGPKHSGKTNLGRVLALSVSRVSASCTCKFIDIDELITEETGKSPRQLYIESPGIFKKAKADAVTSLVRRRTTISENH